MKSGNCNKQLRQYCWQKFFQIGFFQCLFVMCSGQLAFAQVSLQATLNEMSQSIYVRDQTVRIAGTLKSNVSKSYNLELQIKDRGGNKVKSLYLNNKSLLKDVNSAFTFSYLIPSTLKVGIYKLTLIARSTDNNVIYVVNQNSREFNFNTYQPLQSSLGIPASVDRLKTKSGNPFTGGGFVPDTSTAYIMVFHDEFSGSRLDTTKWWTRYIYADGYLDRLNDECQVYRENNNHLVSNGTLKLVARAQAGVPCPGTGNPNYVQWESGMIHSGVIEKSPHQGKGYTYTDPNFDRTWSFWRAPSPLLMTVFDEDFHVISSLWRDDDTVTTYIDGVPLVQYKYNWVDNTGYDGGLAHIMVNLAMGGMWPTHYWEVPIDQVERQLEIDYVRVYQRSDRINKATSTSGKNLCPLTGC